MKSIIYGILFIFIVSFGIKMLAEEGTTTTTSVTKTTGPDIDNTTVTTTSTTTSVNDVDANIVTAIYAKYKKDATLTGTEITATSNNGIVTLDGTVTMQSQADEAIQVAKSIPNVKDVRSTINIKTGLKTPTTTNAPKY